MAHSGPKKYPFRKQNKAPSYHWWIALIKSKNVPGKKNRNYKMGGKNEQIIRRK